MKNIILILSILFLLLCSCQSEASRAQEKLNNQRAIDICIAKGGIPLMNAYGRLETCKFPAEVCKEYEKGRQ